VDPPRDGGRELAEGAPPPGEGFRTGSSLIGDADTQGIAGDFGAGAEKRKFYVQEIDSKEVRDSRDEVDLESAADFEEMKDQRFFFSDKEYYHGWSEGEDVVLLRRDPATGRRVKEVHPFEWYFLLRREEFERIPSESWDWLCRRHARRVEPDALYPERFVRVYVSRRVPKIDHKRIFRNVGDPDRASSWATPYFLGERPGALRFPRDRDRWEPVHEAVEWCRRKGLEPLEADLTPKQRFLTDVDLKIQARYRMGFLDIETDDTVGGFERKEQNRILSIAWEGDRFDSDPSDAGFLRLEEETDAAEREMLLRFKRECVERYDVLAAWNGFGFDFPVIFYRFRKHRIWIDWRYHLFADPLPVFKRHYTRAGADAVSYALDSIGERVLKMQKIDWRTTFRERRPGVVPKFINLYRYEPELLEEYNRYDARILRKLEEFTGFVSIEQIFCRIANGFANDWNISTKIDQLLLKKGYKEGEHFRTRYWSSAEPEKYEGAYVFPPVVGMHENVAALDFKSLYPSMVRAFNISPETIVKLEDREAFLRENGPDSLCRCPLVEVETEGGGTLEKGGATFRRDREGYISQMFVRTLERRKKYTDLQGKRLEEVGTTQDDLYLLYYRLAYSFKRLGLSFYGDMGNARSRYYDTELAEAITLSGRYFIRLTERYAKENGFAVLYGDTDSVFVQLAPTGKTWPSEDARIEEILDAGNRFVAYCQERYLEELRGFNCNLDWNRVELEFEDVYDRIFFVVKKRYAGRMLLHKGGKTDHVEVKGLEVMRSDCSGMTRRLQQRVLDAILTEGLSGDEIERGVVEPEFRRCAEGELSVDEVSIGKGISKDPERYKTTPLHVKLAAEIRETGREYYVGMKVEYVVTGTKPNLSGVTRGDFEDAAGGIAYDAEYYWDRVIFPASQRILEVCFPVIDWSKWLIKGRARRRKLVDRYRTWLADPKRVSKAVARIRENRGDILLEADLEELRSAPRAKRIRDRAG